MTAARRLAALVVALAASWAVVLWLALDLAGRLAPLIG